MKYVNASDEAALAAAMELSKLEGIIPALETAHAISACKMIEEDYVRVGETVTATVSLVAD